jgi:hypothetical protein
MSTEFRAVRPEDHAACVMPMVVATKDEDAASNWNVEPLTSFCPFCDSISRMIVAEYSSRFQVSYFPQSPRPEPQVIGYYCAAD